MNTPEPTRLPNQPAVTMDAIDLYRNRKIKDFSTTSSMEAWGNRDKSVLEVPEGMSADDYVSKLRIACKYVYPIFYIENGEVIQEMFYPIGD